MSRPSQRHPYCKIDTCSTCLADCMALAHYLEIKTGTEGMDQLGAYRKWFDNRGIHTESDYGWPLPIVFDSFEIDLYLKTFD